MRRLIVLSLVLSLLCGGLFADKVELDDGTSQEVGPVKYKSGKVITEDGETYTDGEVAAIYFTSGETGKIEAPEEYELTDEKIKQYRQQAEKMEEKYGDAGGLILEDVGVHRLTNDGKIRYKYHFVGKVLKNKKKSWAKVSGYFRKNTSKYHMLVARSIQPDGSVSKMNKSSIEISQPSRGKRFFSKGQLINFTIPDVQVGSIVEYVYVKETYKPADPKLFDARWFFQSEEPVRHSKVDVAIPKAETLNYILYRLPEFQKEPEISTTDTTRIYTWEVEDMEPLVKEPLMPAYMNSVPALFGNLHKDYDYYFNMVGEKLKEKMEVTPDIRKEVEGVVEGKETKKEKVAAIYHYLQGNVRYISVKGSHLGSGITGHEAQYTFDNKYGDCIDKAILFATMLKVIDVESYPIAVYVNRKGRVKRKEFPFTMANHAINEVWIDGEKYILDATNNYFRFPYFSMGDCDLWYMNSIKEEIDYIPPIKPKNNAVKGYIDMKIFSDGSTEVSLIDSMNGNFEAGYRGYFSRAPEDQHKQIVQNWANSMSPGARVEDFSLNNVEEISQPFSMSIDFNIEKHATFAGDLMIFDIPGVDYSFPGIALKDREFGIKKRMTRRREHNVTIEIPEDYQIEYLPQKINVENNYFSYTAEFEKLGPRKIKFYDRFDQKELRIPVEDYNTYKRDAEKVLAYIEKRVFLSEK